MYYHIKTLKQPMASKFVWQNKESTELFKAILKLKKTGEVAKFFRDLCTLEELKEMTSRWQAVKMISRGKPYREIAQKTGLSTTTVTRVAYWLNYGEGGYKLALSKNNKTMNNNIKLNNHHRINSPRSR